MARAVVLNTASKANCGGGSFADTLSANSGDSLAIPNLISYDPAFAYEIAVIIEEGIRRMYVNGDSVFYYITLMNENYEHPHMPEGSRDGRSMEAAGIEPAFSEVCG